ncbi:MAG TPA: hypothetical protein EYQ21_06940 [Flavobacteriales bacterium]|jgi:hypothetical protein|nr:hypothetical protein [Flavobacteriales bacterium]
MNREDRKYTAREKLLHDLKFSTTLLILYTIVKAKDSIYAVNRKRKSTLSFCKEVKEIIFADHVDTYPNRKDNIL